MSEYNIQMNKYNALNAEYDQLYPKPMKHANTHAKDGSDPITPASIGAYTKTEADALLANKLEKISPIPSGVTSCNDLPTGIFIPNGLSNLPLDGFNGKILSLIEPSSWCQIAVDVLQTKMWFRSHNGFGWISWQTVATATDLDTKVSKSGDTMTGNLAIEKSYPGIFLNNSTLNRSGVIQSDNSDGSLFIRNQKSENNRTQLMLYGEEKSVTEVLSLYLVKNGVGSFYKVLHSGNKPTGSYTGNGSSTLREIDLTNNVNCRGVIIVSTSGYMALITSQGAIIKNGSDTSVTGLPTTQVNWNDGKIKITSTHDALNKNGEIYYYQCL